MSIYSEKATNALDAAVRSENFRTAELDIEQAKAYALLDIALALREKPYTDPAIGLRLLSNG